MADIFEVVAAVRNMGAVSNQQSSASNFLIFNEDEFTSDDYEAFISICNVIREDFTDPWAMEHFSKPAGSLTEEERYRLWAWESNGGLPMDARQVMLDWHINICNAHRIKLSQDFDVDLLPVFHYGMRH